MTTVTAVRGDITEERVDAIVNAANNGMRGGGGVDGAIHRAGGPAVLEDCIARFPDGLATGDAGWTTAGDLPARWVIHTVGPNFAAGERDRSLLESCYRRVLEVADELGARSVAFPLISAGVYGWPRADAIEAAVATIAATRTRVEEVRLVAFDDAVHRQMQAVVLRLFRPPTGAGTVGSLFDRDVAQWGLRGDPYVWRALRARFADTPLPTDWFSLRSLLTRAVEEVIGTPLTSAADAVYLPEFDPGHGMSAGAVSPAWWAQTGIPILLDRQAALADPPSPPEPPTGPEPPDA
ncbi:O-acetyl-ADP-ribose deacetylase [Agromyces sp. MMS24-JH15]|uniref:O-acetyl-ADP-ribose deacetylase n=1 Tax=Agromyces sp. MMS24-JH15 TaxID=3243765 RepID=UPI003747CF30